MNIRELAERDLAKTLEDPKSGFGLPAELTSPDGVEQIFKKNSTTELLTGQILYETVLIDPQTGEQKIIPLPNVSLRIASLDRVPLPKEDWFVRIPIDPSLTAPKFSFVLSGDRDPDTMRSIGYITLYLQKATQTP